MSYTFEMYFTGLCCFHLLPNAQKPEKVRILLVNTQARQGRSWTDPPHHGDDHGEGHPYNGNGGHTDHQHVPYLSVAVRNLIAIGGPPPSPEMVVPAPDAMDCALFNLTGKEVTLESGEAPRFSVNMGRGNNLTPSNVEAGRWFDWITVLKALDSRVSGLRPECLKAPLPDGSGVIAAAVEIPFGKLGTFELGLRGRQLFVFEFRPENGAPNPAASTAQGPRCIADRLVLRAEDLEDPVVIRLGNQAFGIGPDSLPATGTVKASVTNIRTEYRPARPPAVRDFTAYYELVEWTGGTNPAPGTLIIPWVTQAVNGGHTPSTGSCPPTNG